MKAKKRNVKRIRVKKRQQEVNAKNWPIVKVTLPADLKGVKPGEVPAHLLRDVKPYGKLHWRAADAYHAMRAKAFADKSNHSNQPQPVTPTVRLHHRPRRSSLDTRSNRSKAHRHALGKASSGTRSHRPWRRSLHLAHLNTTSASQ
jgi:hypothetical protein